MCKGMSYKINSYLNNGERLTENGERKILDLYAFKAFELTVLRTPVLCAPKIYGDPNELRRTIL